MEDRLRAILPSSSPMSVFVEFAVDATSQGGQGRFSLADTNPVFKVTFSNGGNVPQLVPDGSLLTGNDAIVTVCSDGVVCYPPVPFGQTPTPFTSIPGNQVGGSFRLLHAGWSTPAIPFDASVTEMAAALQALPALGTVSVRRSALSPTLTATWTITFLTFPGTLPAWSTASLPILTAEYNFVASPAFGLTATNAASSLPLVTVALLSSPAQPLGGTFALSYNGNVTTPLRFSASAAEVKAALEALPLWALWRCHVRCCTRARASRGW